MRSTRLVFAIIAGVGLTSVSALLLNVPSQAVLIVAFLLIAPGGIVGSHLFRISWLVSPVPVLALNAAIYSTIAYLLLHRLRYQLSKSKVLLLASGAVLLACLACTPSLSPLWPRGMSQMAEREKSLSDGLRPGSDLSSAQTFLRAQGIDLYEYNASEEQTVLQRADFKIVGKTWRPHNFRKGRHKCPGISLLLSH